MSPCSAPAAGSQVQGGSVSSRFAESSGPVSVPGRAAPLRSLTPHQKAESEQPDVPRVYRPSRSPRKRHAASRRGERPKVPFQVQAGGAVLVTVGPGAGGAQGTSPQTRPLLPHLCTWVSVPTIRSFETLGHVGTATGHVDHS